VIAEQELERGLARLMNFSRFALYNHPRLHFGSAGRHQSAVDFHQANQARGERTAFLQVTKCWNLNPELTGSVQHTLTGRNLHGSRVDADTERAHLFSTVHGPKFHVPGADAETRLLTMDCGCGLVIRL